jgi:type IV secretory pathway TrbF-like protein
MNVQYQDQLFAYQNQWLWRLWGGSCVLIASLVTAIVVLVLKPPLPPYVIAVDGRGEPVEAAQPVLGTAALKQPIIYWTLSQYIQNAFRIERNYDDEQRNLATVYNMSSPDSVKVLGVYYHRGNDPIALGLKFHQTVVVTRTLALPTKDQYQVDFKTIRTPYGGDDGTVTTAWRATMQIVQAKATAENPLGIYVLALDFAPESGG